MADSPSSSAGRPQPSGPRAEAVPSTLAPAPAAATAPVRQLDDLLGPGAAGSGRRWLPRLVWLALLLALAGLGWWAWSTRQAEQAKPSYTTEPLGRGSVRQTVTANGTLQPTRSVKVGSELSGTVKRVRVDVNDQVKRGQVLVELDTDKLKDQVERSTAALASARASRAQAQATVTEARSSLARFEEVARLSGGRVPSATELDTARAALARARANDAAAVAAITQAEAQLATDRTNLGKAAIRSPIDGVVLARAVDPGNAVAASLQAVTLFTIGEDLTRMQLEASVDEADVGAVQAGQQATFTVSAHGSRRHPATVTRVAYGSTLTDNVVTYTTLLQVDNRDLSLRPGMTAVASITATQRDGVFVVPQAALRFTPSGVRAAEPAGPAASGAGRGASSGGGGAAGRSGAGGSGSGNAGAANRDAGGQGATGGSSGGLIGKLMPRPPRMGATSRRGASAARQIWVLEGGVPKAVPVEVGISDGKITEVSAPELREGLAVIVDEQLRKAAP